MQVDPPSDVLFNYGDPGVAVLKKDSIETVDADMAAVIMTAGATDVQWPLEAINQAMAILYNNWLCPQLYAARNDQERVVGYLAMGRRELNQSQVNKIYYRILHENTTGPTVQTPFVCEGLAFGEPVGLCAFEWVYGPDLPLRAINYAIWTLYNQPDWPEEPLFLYPAGRGESLNHLSGVVVAQSMTDYGKNRQMDDAWVEGILALNSNELRSQFPTEFRPERGMFR